MNPARICFLLLSLAGGWLPAGAQSGVLMRAMRDELDRSMRELRLGDLDRPYFVSYSVQEVSEIRAAASLGGLSTTGESASRTLHVEVRVGDRNLDNTNFVVRPDFSSMEDMSFGTVSFPLEENYEELRRGLWLATDRAYKHALDHIAKKRAVLQNETVVEEVPDFSIEEPHQYQGASDQSPPDASRLRALAAELSLAFREQAHIHVSSVEVSARLVRVQYVSSEGSSFLRDDPSTAVTVRAGSRAADGTEVSDSFTAFGRTLEDLPAISFLSARSRELASRLKDLREAQVFERYVGPVLFEGQAAAELVRQVLLPRLLVQKVPLADDGRMRQAMDRFSNPFQDKLGSRVLPRFLAIADDPTLRENEDGPLWGGYAVDDEGVPAQQVQLVRRGMLKTLLSTRNPIAGIPQSNGHMRGGGPAPSNLVVTSSSGLTADEMSEEFRALLEERELEYGVAVRRIRDSGSRSLGGGSPGRARGGRLLRAVVAVKVFADGREELIRDAVLTGLSEGSFRDIVAASDALTSHSFRFRSVGPSFDPFASINAARRFGTVVSVVVPSLLFEDVSVRRPPGNIPHPPVVPKPASGD